MIKTVDDLINVLTDCKNRYPEFGGGPLERTFSDEDIENFIKAMEG